MAHLGVSTGEVGLESSEDSSESDFQSRALTRLAVS